MEKANLKIINYYGSCSFCKAPHFYQHRTLSLSFCAWLSEQNLSREKKVEKALHFFRFPWKWEFNSKFHSTSGFPCMMMMMRGRHSSAKSLFLQPKQTEQRRIKQVVPPLPREKEEKEEREEDGFWQALKKDGQLVCLSCLVISCIGQPPGLTSLKTEKEGEEAWAGEEGNKTETKSKTFKGISQRKLLSIALKFHLFIALLSSFDLIPQIQTLSPFQLVSID